MSDPSTYAPPEAQDQCSLDAAKQWLQTKAQSSGGAICPCCDELQKARGCKPTPGQAAMLVVMYNNYQVGQTVDAAAIATALGREDMKPTGLDKMVHWDLLENTNTKNHFTLCEGGYFFVHKGFPITPRAWIMSDRVVGRDGKPTKLVKLLGNKYDLNELLSMKLS